VLLACFEEEAGVTTALAFEEDDVLVLALQYPEARFAFFFNPLEAGLPCCLLLRIGSPWTLLLSTLRLRDVRR